MNLQILTYHRTEPDPDPAKLHLVADREFVWQVEAIGNSGIPVLDLRQSPQRRGHCLAVTFDDGFLSDLRNAEILHSHGLTATFFVSTALVGTPGYLDWPDIRRLHALGMALGSHAHQHVRLTTLPVGQVREDLATSRRMLQEVLGESVDAIAFPGGDYDDTVVAVAREVGFRQLFTTHRGVNQMGDARIEGLLKRNNVIRAMTPKAFSELLTGRPSLKRRLVHGVAASARALLPDKGYNALRSLAARLRAR